MTNLNVILLTLTTLYITTFSLEQCSTTSTHLIKSNSLSCTVASPCAECQYVTCNDCSSVEMGLELKDVEPREVFANGNPTTGVMIRTTGLHSTRFTTINGINVNQLSFSGEWSFADSVLEADCLGTANCMVMCGGVDSCFASDMTISHAGSFMASGDSSAEYTKAVFTDPNPGFSMLCSGAFSCLKSDLEILVTSCGGNSVWNLGEIVFSAMESAQDAHITITNQDPTCTVVIPKWTCSAPAACHLTKVAVFGNVDVQDCACTLNGQNADVCSTITYTGDDPTGGGLKTCFSNLVTTASPTPRPTTKAPTPRPTTKVPTPYPTTKAPTPRPTTKAPTPRPTTKVPTPRPTTKVPTPRPTTKVPTPMPTTKVPTPRPTTKTPTAPIEHCLDTPALHIIPDEACKGRHWDINNPISFMAHGVMSAGYAFITYEAPMPGFNMRCAGEMSCMGADLEIVVRNCGGSTLNLGTLTFEGDESGWSTHVTFLIEDAQCTVQVESFDCIGADSCKDMNIITYGPGTLDVLDCNCHYNDGVCRVTGSGDDVTGGGVVQCLASGNMGPLPTKQPTTPAPVTPAPVTEIPEGECIDDPNLIIVGDDACYLQEWTINNAYTFNAKGASSAEKASIVFANPRHDQEFTLGCEGDFSCLGANLEIVIDGCEGFNTHHLGTLEFIGDESGYYSHVTINNKDSLCTVYIDNWNCVGTDSCNGMTVSVYGNVVVSDCLCAYNNGVCHVNGAGEDITGGGVIACLAGDSPITPTDEPMFSECIDTEELTLVADEACKAQDWHQTHGVTFEAKGDSSAEIAVIVFDNPVPDFSLDCSGFMSCAKADLEIIISECDGDSYNLGTLSFTGVQSGEHTHVTINNDASDCTVYIDNWVCEGSDSCENMHVFIIGDVTVSNCHCGYNNGVCDSVTTSQSHDPSGVVTCLSGESVSESESSESIEPINDGTDSNLNSMMSSPNGWTTTQIATISAVIIGIVLILVVVIGFCLRRKNAIIVVGVDEVNKYEIEKQKMAGDLNIEQHAVVKEDSTTLNKYCAGVAADESDDGKEETEVNGKTTIGGEDEVEQMKIFQE